MFYYFLVGLCFWLPISVGEGTKYIRLPSGFTFPELSNYKNGRYHSSGNDYNERPRPIPPSSPPRVHLGNHLAEIPGSAYYTPPPPAGVIAASATEGFTNRVPDLDQYKEIVLKKTEKVIVEGGGGLLPEEGEGTRMEPAGEGTTMELSGEGTRGDAEEGEKTLEEVKKEGTHGKKNGRIKTTSAKNKNKVIQDIAAARGHGNDGQNLGNVLAALGGGQYYQSIFGGRGGFSPLSFFLNAGAGRGQTNPLIVPVPIVVPPPPPPPPGPKCYTNPSGFLCCNTTLETTMENAFKEVRAEGISLCNAQKMATAVQEAAEAMFGTTFESIVAHRDFVAKVNFAAYATPTKESDVNIIDANSFFSGDAEELLEGNGTESGKPTYIVYGPI